MGRKPPFVFAAIALLAVLVLQLTITPVFAQPPGQPTLTAAAFAVNPADTVRKLAPYFELAGKGKKGPDPKGFIQRWLVLEPVKKEIARNNIFTDSFLRASFANDNFSEDFTRLPKNGDIVQVGNQKLKWHAIDSKLFNFKLYRFSWAINKPQNGVLFWLVTVIDCPQDLKNVRLAAGCNSAGAFWLNGQEALMISGDKDMVVDFATSKRVTLHKGKNIIRAAVINGPGMVDFCLRLLDEKGEPVKNFSITLD